MRQEQFGQMWPLYQKLRDYLCSLGSPGFDVKEFAKVKSRNTFEMDFGMPDSPSRKKARNGFVQVRARPNHLLLWVRLDPDSISIPSGLTAHSRRRPGGGRFALEIFLENPSKLDKAKTLLRQAYERKKGEGPDRQPKI